MELVSTGSSLQVTSLVGRSFTRLCFGNANKITKERIFRSAWPVTLLEGRRGGCAIQTVVLHREAIHPLRKIICTGICICSIRNIVASRLLTIAIACHLATKHLLLVDISSHLLGKNAYWLVALHWRMHSSILCILCSIWLLS